MTIAELKNKIIQWIKTGEPKNIKSYNVRTLLQEIAKKLPDVESFNLNKIYAIKRNANDLASVEINPVEYTPQSLEPSEAAQALKNLGIITIKIEGSQFYLLKKPGNTEDYVQSGDIAIDGFKNTEFKQALEFISGNPELFDNWNTIGEGQPYEWLSLQNQYDVIPFPAMTKGQARVIRIVEPGTDTVVPDGWATIGGWDGVRVGHMAMVICMQDSEGGTYASVGRKYAIVANYTQERQIITVADHASLPDEVNAILGVLYLTLDTGNLYYFDATAGDYMLVGSIVEGTLISDTEFQDINNNPVVPDGTHLYKDTGTEIYYKWDGLKFIEFTQGGGGVVTESSLLLDSTYPELDILLDAERFQRVFNQKILRATRIEKRISESVSGSKNISLSYPAGHYDLTMTGATTLAFTDMIEEDETTVISLTVTGNYALTMPGFLEKSESSDDYEGTMINEIVINIKKGGINPEGYYTISNYEI